MDDELTPEQAREHHLARIRYYAIEHNIAGEHIALIFNAGLAVAHTLRPDILGTVPSSQRKAA